jgi:hypothetical protein
MESSAGNNWIELLRMYYDIRMFGFVECPVLEK